MWHEEKAALADDHRSKLQVAAMLEAERPDAAADYERIVGPAAADAPPMSFSDFEHAVNDAFAKVFRLVERTPDGARQQLELSRARAEWDSYEYPRLRRVLVGHLEFAAAERACMASAAAAADAARVRWADADPALVEQTLQAFGTDVRTTFDLVYGPVRSGDSVAAVNAPHQFAEMYRSLVSGLNQRLNRGASLDDWRRRVAGAFDGAVDTWQAGHDDVTLPADLVTALRSKVVTDARGHLRSAAQGAYLGGITGSAPEQLELIRALSVALPRIDAGIVAAAERLPPDVGITAERFDLLRLSMAAEARQAYAQAADRSGSSEGTTLTSLALLARRFALLLAETDGRVAFEAAAGPVSAEVDLRLRDATRQSAESGLELAADSLDRVEEQVHAAAAQAIGAIRDSLRGQHFAPSAVTEARAGVDTFLSGLDDALPARLSHEAALVGQLTEAGQLFLRLMDEQPDVPESAVQPVAESFRAKWIAAFDGHFGEGTLDVPGWLAREKADADRFTAAQAAADEAKPSDQQSEQDVALDGDSAPYFLAGYDFGNLPASRRAAFFREMDMAAGTVPSAAQLWPDMLPEGPVSSGAFLSPGVRGRMLPKFQIIPCISHHIWFGGPLHNDGTGGSRTAFMTNLAAAARAAPSFEFVVWTDVPRDEIAHALESDAPAGTHDARMREMAQWAQRHNIRLINFDEIFGAAHPMSAVGDPVRTERARGNPVGWAVASELALAEILYRFGGVHNDGDNGTVGPGDLARAARAAANSASGFATRKAVPQLVNSGLSAVAGSRGTSEYLNVLRKNYNPPFSGPEVINLGAEVENGPVSVGQVDTGTASPQAMFPNVAVALGLVRAGDGLGAVPSGADPRDAGSEEPPAYEGEQTAGGLLAGAEDESAPPAAREQGRSIKWNFDFAADGAELDGAVGAHVMDWVQLFSRDF